MNPDLIVKIWHPLIMNERGIEIPNLIDFVNSKKPTSLLDVGAHYSWYYYAKNLKPLLKKYDGIDILPDPQTKEILSNYYVDNFNTFSIPQYDMVVCVSTIEHAGISTYKGPYEAERANMYKRCIETAKKYAWLSFPIGLKSMDEGQFANITASDMSLFEHLTQGYTLLERFFYSKGASLGYEWTEHTDREFALQVPYDPSMGVQSVCIMEITK